MITTHRAPVRKCRVCKRSIRSWNKTVMCCGKPIRGLTPDIQERIDFVSEQFDRDTDNVL